MIPAPYHIQHILDHNETDFPFLFYQISTQRITFNPFFINIYSSLLSNTYTMKCAHNKKKYESIIRNE